MILFSVQAAIKGKDANGINESFAERARRAGVHSIEIIHAAFRGRDFCHAFDPCCKMLRIDRDPKGVDFGKEALTRHARSSRYVVLQLHFALVMEVRFSCNESNGLH